MMASMRSVALGLLLAGAAAAWAQTPGRIYTCVDAKGGRLTSDRPIPECTDRIQRELNQTGTTRRTIGPTLTPIEQELQDEKDRLAAAEAKRVAEEKRREKLLIARYPNRIAHDRERGEALKALDAVVAEAGKRIVALEAQRKTLLTETEFYKANPAKMPAQLKRKIEENEQQIGGQQRFLANQDEEKRRINARFDEELATLKTLWATRLAPVPVTPTAAAAMPAASTVRR
jgi:hypothetical protein